MIVYLETSVQLALIASGCTLLGQIANILASSRRASRAKAERAELAKKVEIHNEVVVDKLDNNTNITQNASDKATQAYNEANSFNLKFAAIAQSEEYVRNELVRLSKNIHQIANALTPFIGQLDLESRKKDKGDNEDKK